MNVKLSSVLYTGHKHRKSKMSSSDINLITDEGRKLLGSLMKAAREELGMSIDSILVYIAKATNHSLSKSAISDLENGKTEPKWNTLAIISAAGYVKNPETGEPYSTSELFRLACGVRIIDNESRRIKRTKKAKVKPDEFSAFSKPSPIPT